MISGRPSPPVIQFSDFLLYRQEDRLVVPHIAQVSSHEWTSEHYYHQRKTAPSRDWRTPSGSPVGRKIGLQLGAPLPSTPYDTTGQRKKTVRDPLGKGLRRAGGRLSKGPTWRILIHTNGQPYKWPQSVELSVRLSNSHRSLRLISYVNSRAEEEIKKGKKNMAISPFPIALSNYTSSF